MYANLNGHCTLLWSLFFFGLLWGGKCRRRQPWSERCRSQLRQVYKSWQNVVLKALCHVAHVRVPAFLDSLSFICLFWGRGWSVKAAGKNTESRSGLKVACHEPITLRSPWYGRSLVTGMPWGGTWPSRKLWPWQGLQGSQSDRGISPLDFVRLQESHQSHWRLVRQWPEHVTNAR
jgi:hypothetical protein